MTLRRKIAVPRKGPWGCVLAANHGLSSNPLGATCVTAVTWGARATTKVPTRWHSH